MLKCILAVALVSVVSARPGLLTYGVPAHVTYAAGHVSSQHHAQDDLGQYTYGYNTDSSSKTEQRTLDGITRGAYSYVDAEGKLQSVHYTADPLHGFRVAATNLPEHSAVAPVPVQDTPEVAQAKSEHFAAVEEIKVRNAAAPVEVPAPIVPEVKYEAPVVPEVKYGTPVVPEVPTVKYVAPFTTLGYNAPVVVPHTGFAYSAYHPYHYSPLAHFGHYAHFAHFAPQAEIKTIDVVGKTGYPYA